MQFTDQGDGLRVGLGLVDHGGIQLFQRHGFDVEELVMIELLTHEGASGSDVEVDDLVEIAR